MPQPASLSLQKVIHETLTADTTLTALLNGTHIYDHVPQTQPPPYIAMAQIMTRDRLPECEEHFITLGAWSDSPGRKQLLEILDTVRISLHDILLSLEDHHLVNLRYLDMETGRHKQSRKYRGQIRFRAVTEPI